MANSTDDLLANFINMVGSGASQEHVARALAEAAHDADFVRLANIVLRVAAVAQQRPAANPHPGCDLCGDAVGPVFFHAKCHPSAPLSASMESGVLTLRCYVPSCKRVVVSMRVSFGGGASPFKDERGS